MDDLLTAAARSAPGGTALVVEVIDGKVRYRPAQRGARQVDAFVTREVRPARVKAAGRGHHGTLQGIELCEPADEQALEEIEAGTAVYYNPVARRLTYAAEGLLCGYVAGSRLAKLAGGLSRVYAVELIGIPHGTPEWLERWSAGVPEKDSRRGRLVATVDPAPGQPSDGPSTARWMLAPGAEDAGITATPAGKVLLLPDGQYILEPAGVAIDAVHIRLPTDQTRWEDAASALGASIRLVADTTDVGVTRAYLDGQSGEHTLNLFRFL